MNLVERFKYEQIEVEKLSLEGKTQLYWVLSQLVSGRIQYSVDLAIRILLLEDYLWILSNDRVLKRQTYDLIRRFRNVKD